VKNVGPGGDVYCEDTLAADAGAGILECVTRAQAAGGGAVYLKSGTYKGALGIVVPENVTITGASDARVMPTGTAFILSARSRLETIHIDMASSTSGPAVDIAGAGGVTIQGVHFSSGDPSSGLADTTAIGQSYSGGAPATNIRIVDNVFDQTGGGSADERYCTYGGVVVFNGSGITESIIDRNTIGARGCHGGGGYGIEIGRAHV
jgi:hypothetical protein